MSWFSKYTQKKKKKKKKKKEKKKEKKKKKDILKWFFLVPIKHNLNVAKLEIF